jgi:cobalt/nickel transport system permease protein
LAAGFIAGFGAALGSALLVALALSLADQGFLRAAGLLVVSHVPVMVMEGGITLFIVGFLARVQPDMLDDGGRKE